MLFIPSALVGGHKRKLEILSGLAQIFFVILCSLVHSNQAGVIKKRDTAIAATAISGDIGLDLKEMEAVNPMLNNTTSIASTGLVLSPNFVTAASKELANNEILRNRIESKKFLQVAVDESNLKKNETTSAEDNSKIKLETTTTTNPQDLKSILEHLKNMESSLNETPKTTTEFSSNDIKEEKIQKLLNRPLVDSPKDKLDSNDEESSSSSLENNLKLNNDKSPTIRSPSKILTDLKSETEKYLTKTKDENQQIENSIETEIKKKIAQKELKILEKVTTKPYVLTTLKSITNFSRPLMPSSEEKVTQSPSSFEEFQLITSTAVPKVTESLQVLQTSTIVPLKDSENKNKMDSSLTDLDGAEDRSKKIHKDLDQSHLQASATLASILNLEEDKLKTLAKAEKDLLIVESNKKDNARSMKFMEETTTISSKELDDDDDDVLSPITTFKPPLILSIKDDQGQVIKEINEDNLRNQIEGFNTTNLTLSNVSKGKKPKFINDNSTNAQQLNLPNNAEVWSLASMKSLPKSNVTIETAQTHNKTNKEFKQENISQNISLPLNNNSEKNLLDWSQIMMDKELSTTTRHEDYYNSLHELEAEKVKQNHLTNKDSNSSTTLMPQIEVTPFKIQPEENMVTKSSLMEDGTTTSSIVGPPVPTSTILSSLNYNENENDNDNDTNTSQADKKVEESINNHIDMFTATLTTTRTTTTTTVATNVDNNPFNTSLNIEPNLNEINLTANQTTQVDLNNDAHNTTSVGDDDANVNNVYIETSSVAATTTLAPQTTTKSTAVVDMTTVEQISSETTTVSTLKTTKQYASLNNDVAISQEEQQNNKNKINNVIIYEQSNSSSSLPIFSHNNDLENKQNEIIVLNRKKTTTVVVPITTFRPTILAITSTTSTPATHTTTTTTTIEQEVDQNSNEIRTNLTNRIEKPSIIKTIVDLHYNHSMKTNETHLTEREFFETTTHETFTTTAATTTTTTTATATARSTAEIKKPNEIEKNTLSTTTTTFSKDEEEEINETTTEKYLDSTISPIQTTPKQVDEHKKHRGDIETTTGSSVWSTGEKFEKENEIKTTTEANLSLNTSTETPVVVTYSEVGKELFENITPTTTTTAAATTTTTTQQIIIASTTAKEESDIKENILSEEDAKIKTTTKTTIMNNTTQEITTTAIPVSAVKEEETYISLLDDTITTTTHTYSSTVVSTTDTTNTPTKTMTTTTTTSPSTTTPTSLSSSTLPSAIATKVEEIYNVINSTTTELIKTTTQQLLTENEEDSSSETPSTSTSSTSTHFTNMLPPVTTTRSSQVVDTADTGKGFPTLTTLMGVNNGNMYPKNSQAGETDVNVIIAITVSVIGVVALILLVGFLSLMRKRQKQTSYSQRCRPVSLDEYTIDNASVSGSMRKGSALRASKRTYGNLAFDDPALRPNPMSVHELAKFVQEKLRIFEEFRDVPQITSRLDEVPTGCEDKNRYANVLPLPETRVILQRLNDDEKSEYINANYVTGPKDPPNYYIACQAPLESTVEDFWRMIWEQQSRVIIQATDLIENGVEKCAEYLPPSVTLDNHSTFGDFQITLQNREVKDKYAISTILLKHVTENAARELTHYWYKWPEVGVPAEEAPIIAMLLEARSSLISYAIEQANEDKEKSLKSAEEGTVPVNDSITLPTINSNGSNSANGSSGEINGNISMVPLKKTAKNQGPLTIHCSPGTGRTGTIIACDVAIRNLETPKRTVDIPQIVYYVRRGRASAVLTKEQYEFIYKVANMYAAKITNPTNYN